MFCFTNPYIPRYSCTAQCFCIEEKEAGYASSNEVYREILSKTNTCVNDFNYVDIKKENKVIVEVIQIVHDTERIDDIFCTYVYVARIPDAALR